MLAASHRDYGASNVLGSIADQKSARHLFRSRLKALSARYSGRPAQFNSPPSKAEDCPPASVGGTFSFGGRR